MSTNNVISGSATDSPTPRVSRSRRSWLWLLLALPLAAVGVSFSIAYAHGGGRGGRGEMGGLTREHMARVLDAAGASDKQKAEIQKIWEGVRPQLKDLHEQGAQVRKQIQEALAAPRIDASGIEKLRTQSMQLMDKASAIVTRNMIASAQMLTPEQRQKIAAKIREHGPGSGFGLGRHFRHRFDRDIDPE